MENHLADDLLDTLQLVGDPEFIQAVLEQDAGQMDQVMRDEPPCPPSDGGSPRRDEREEQQLFHEHSRGVGEHRQR
jgi:hypothetical protein